MTEREKMLAGRLYDCGDPELLAQWHRAKDLVRDYNAADSADLETKEAILSQLLGGRGKNVWITPPFYVDYGVNIFLGNNCEINMNCVFLDDNRIVIGDNAWIGGGVLLMPGVTVGDNVVIGAGSVVTKDIPSNTIAYGNPCRAVRENRQEETGRRTMP